MRLFWFMWWHLVWPPPSPIVLPAPDNHDAGVEPDVNCVTSVYRHEQDEVWYISDST